MPPVGFEPTVSAGERPQTYALDRTATGTGIIYLYIKYNYIRMYIRHTLLFSGCAERKAQWRQFVASVT